MDDAASTLNGRNPWSWYPVAASRDLVCGAIMPIVLNGESVVVWRSRSGAASAWSDRCPHRGMRLSYGAIHGESLICPYHGWTFGNDGYCVRIPAHPQTIPSRAAKTRIYPAVEADGYVWVCIGEPATDRPAPVPVLAHDRTQHVRTLHVPVETDVATAALLLSPLNAVDPKGDPIGFDTMRWTAVEGGACDQRLGLHRNGVGRGPDDLRVGRRGAAPISAAIPADGAGRLCDPAGRRPGGRARPQSCARALSPRSRPAPPGAGSRAGSPDAGAHASSARPRMSGRCRSGSFHNRQEVRAWRERRIR